MATLKQPKLWFSIFLLVLSQQVISQQIISGKITDAKGQPVEGATISNKTTKTTANSLKDGSFKIVASLKDLLEIKSVGLKTTVVSVNSSAVNVSLELATAELQEVIMVGTRRTGRTKTESPVPVDVININSVGETTAKPDLESILNMSVPSFNYNKQSGADGSDAIDMASLRGLGFDQTLVLINGKRRHQSAFITEFGTRGRGNSGTDLNAIPEAAIDRVEILRDGASAQYGSDAIAGVMNIILKKDVKKLTINTGYSGYYDQKYNSLNSVDPTQYYTGAPFDGQTFNLGLNYGLPVGKKGGFINFGGNFLTQGKTFRAVPDTNWTTNQNALSTDTWRRAFGDGGVTSGGVLFNSEIPIKGTNTTFYAFGGYNYKHSNVYAWTRNFSSKPFKFPTYQDGTLMFVSSIMRQSSDGETYYNPQEDVYIRDISLAMGIRGTTKNDWDWDLSNVVGYNDFHYFGNKTFNASLQPVYEQAIKTRFDDGGFNFLQNTTNLDFTKHFGTASHGVTVSFGGEFRYERYQIYKGESDSYAYGGAYYIDNNGDTVNKASGSQGFPGFQPIDEVTATRTNVGVYADAAYDVTKNWLVDGAVRFENYSDFGFVNTYKLATRYKLTDNFNVRGSVSTGFRAPSLQQINFSNTNTNIVAGQLQYVKLVPNYSNIARIAGIPKLTDEQSVNASAGFAWKPVRNLTVTVDGYWIQIKNRVVLSGQFSASLPSLAPYIPQNPPISSVQFFANAVNTTNTGVDIVLDYTKKWKTHSLKILFAANLQNINIDKINVPAPLNDNYFDQQTFYSTREQAFLKASAPKSKLAFTAEYGIKKFSIGTHLTYYGQLTTQGFGYSSLPNAAPNGPGGAGISDQGLGYDPYVTTDDGSKVVPENFIFHGKLTTDVYTSYQLCKAVSWVIGVDNIFNVHPDLAVTAGAHMASWGDSESGGPFESVQMGYNGMRFFSRLLIHL